MKVRTLVGALAGASLLTLAPAFPLFAQSAASEVDITEGNPGDIYSWGYTPPTITIQAGQSIDFVNQGAQFHTATADDGSWDTSAVVPGQGIAVEFDTPGTFTYHCTPHPWMTGTITVVAAGDSSAAQPADNSGTVDDSSAAAPDDSAAAPAPDDSGAPAPDDGSGS